MRTTNAWKRPLFVAIRRKSLALVGFALAIGMIVLMPGYAHGDDGTSQQALAPSGACGDFAPIEMPVPDDAVSDSSSLRAKASDSSGLCKVEIEISKLADSASGVSATPCIVTFEPQVTEDGIGFNRTITSACGRLDIHARITVAADTSTQHMTTAGPKGVGVQPAGGAWTQSGINSSLAIAKIIAWDPVGWPMITHYSRLSWTHTPNLMLSWTWDGSGIVLETWTASLLSDGGTYSIHTREARTWFHAYYDSGDAFENAVGIPQPVNITMKTQATGEVGGGYACDFWDSGFVGQVLVVGVPISNLQVHYYCTYSSD